ncbi:MAG: hydantoinase B/oxoprolinase family protein, partial [Burkholderiaceae bacterium]|nr:hydantoinase B/oxoprolinase family protein [Burkholderiaceae bacterium]
YRGGLGVEIDFHLRDGTAYLTLVGDRGLYGPHGLAGGSPGLPADHEFHRDGKSFRSEFHTKIDRLYISQSDGVRLKTPGGGGYGEPGKRAVAQNEADLLDGYVSPG